jgi:hypothetical protein
MKNRLTSTEGGLAYYVCRPRARHAIKARRAGLSDKHKTLTLCVLCAFAVNSCLNNNELISKN